jgi:predicted enzyme related to lactoylglutathione lyase
MGNPVVHFELIGPDPARLRDFYTQLFDWDAPVGSPVADRISTPTDYSFITPDPDAPPAAGGIGGGPGFDNHAIFYVGVPNVANALAKAETLGAVIVLSPQRSGRLHRWSAELSRAPYPMGHIRRVVTIKTTAITTRPPAPIRTRPGLICRRIIDGRKGRWRCDRDTFSARKSCTTPNTSITDPMIRPPQLLAIRSPLAI